MCSLSGRLSQWPDIPGAWRLYVVSALVKTLVQGPAAGTILYMRPANERRRYTVTSSLIGWAHSEIDPCVSWLGRPPNRTEADYIILYINTGSAARSHQPFWITSSGQKGDSKHRQ